MADGRRDRGTTHDGVLTDFVDDDVLAGHRIRQNGSLTVVGPATTVVPWDQVTGWQVVCDCGWAGRTVPAITDPEDGTRCAGTVEEQLHPDWVAHAAPHDPVSELPELFELDELGRLVRLVAERGELEWRINDAGHTARRRGASWGDVGRCVGLTRQGAQQRWSPESGLERGLEDG